MDTGFPGHWGGGRGVGGIHVELVADVQSTLAGAFFDLRVGLPDLLPGQRGDRFIQLRPIAFTLSPRKNVSPNPYRLITCATAYGCVWEREVVRPCRIPFADGFTGVAEELRDFARVDEVRDDGAKCYFWACFTDESVDCSHRSVWPVGLYFAGELPGSTHGCGQDEDAVRSLGEPADLIGVFDVKAINSDGEFVGAHFVVSPFI